MPEPGNPVAPERPNTLTSDAEVVNIVFTYDDGPFVRVQGHRGVNTWTKRVLDTLEAAELVEEFGAVKVAFFWQYVHLHDEENLFLVRRARAAGHVVAIHGGSLPGEGQPDHHWHPDQALDPVDEANMPPLAPGEQVVFANLLHADLFRMIRRLQQVLPDTYVPEFVRAPQGRTSSMRPPWSNTNRVYEWMHLTHVLWNVDSRDTGKDRGVAEVEATLRSQTKAALRGPWPAPAWPASSPSLDGPPRASANDSQYPRGPGNDLVVLFHDHRPTSVENVHHFMRVVADTVRGLGKVPRFVTSTDEIREVFRRRAPWDRWDHPWHNLAESEDQ